ncbi:hypothetical protein [Acetobacter orientalis]|uniref:hypothetical protein n=1 Tax=Acetobacter orientalis TaxID=146474 RepID=UPI0039E77AAF
MAWLFGHGVALFAGTLWGAHAGLPAAFALPNAVRGVGLRKNPAAFAHNFGTSPQKTLSRLRE